MAILKIARMGHPILKQRAAEVSDPTGAEIRNLINDMIDTLADVGGAGLAAPQVHVPLRVVIFQVPAKRIRAEDNNPEAEGIPLTALINPVIEPLSPEQTEGIEACLSVPGLAGMVPRWTSIRYSAISPTGDIIETVAKGFHARVVQHEVDHLDGIVFLDRIRSSRDLFERRRALPEEPDR